MSSAFDCTDSARLTWNREPGAVSYRLNALKGTYLEPVAQTSDSTYRLDGVLAGSSWFSVAPIFSNVNARPISRTFHYPDGDASCYLKSFSVMLNGQDAVVSFTLHSLDRIAKIFIEKEGASSFLSVKELVPGGLSHDYIERNITKGMHRYRIRLLLKNGQTILSKPASVYFFGGDSHLVFPNPVTHGSVTIIQQGTANGTLRLFTIDGRLLLKRRLTATQNSIDLHHLPAGFYVYEMRTETGRQTGKLIVR
jgi:hypothetical protein